MKMRTVCLSPSLATPGMTLTSPVSGRDGLPLLAAGTELDADILERLIRRGVETVWVAVADSRDEQTIAMELQYAAERTDYIFRGNGSPAREALKKTIVDYRRESLK